MAQGKRLKEREDVRDFFFFLFSPRSVFMTKTISAARFEVQNEIFTAHYRKTIQNAVQPCVHSW